MPMVRWWTRWSGDERVAFAVISRRNEPASPAGAAAPAGAEPAPVLVLAVGNPSRGDDALGPMLAEMVEGAALPGVEVIVEFQLQVENALDLEGRERVIFVDAGIDTAAPFELRQAQPAEDFLHTSHALSPELVLATYVRVRGGAPPPSTILCVRGESFELGEGLSETAVKNMQVAGSKLLDLCRPRAAGAGPAAR
jgi:hydrogenase maturation protease